MKFSFAQPLIFLNLLMFNNILLARGLPDTGIIECNTGINASPCLIDNIDNNADFVGQDGHIGRDAAAIKGILTKIGGGKSGFDYSKICNNGERENTGNCPANPSLGTASNNWGCTIDNISELIWEVKLADTNVLRSADYTYTWYNSDNSINGGSAGIENGGEACFDTINCDTEKFVNQVNNMGLCGKTDWRLPSRRELNTLPDLSHRITSSASPAIDFNYFPNTMLTKYWTSSPTTLSTNPNGYIGTREYAWIVLFTNGLNQRIIKSLNNIHIRLVRGEHF